jgi:DNA-binding response OmpR family regulator
MSRSKRASTFQDPGPARSGHSISSSRSYDTTMRRILLVEDNQDLADGLQRNLEHEGHEVTIARSAAEAIAAAQRQSPDLVVLDLGLPDRDGYYVLEQLRGASMNGPVLILSARGLESDKIRGFRLGADDYVTKPFGVMELMARIAALLRRVGGEPAKGNGALHDDTLRSRYGLTDRQIEIARLLALGHANAEIAEMLGISPFTARNHTEQVLGKLGASTRARVGAILRGAI